MIFLKAVWRALVEVFGFFKLSPSLLVEAFWVVCGMVALVMSIVLFPVLVWRKYGEVKRESSKRAANKSKIVKIRRKRFV